MACHVIYVYSTVLTAEIFLNFPRVYFLSFPTGPRHIRYESVLIRALSMSGAMPFDSLQVADIGDVPIVPYNIQRSCDIITDYYNNVLKANCTPLTMGGDHTLTYPILRAIKEKYGAVGLVHIDAHHDLQDDMMGEPIAHGTPFKRALDEELIDPTKMFQIGLRGSMYSFEEIHDSYTGPQSMVSYSTVLYGSVKS